MCIVTMVSGLDERPRCAGADEQVTELATIVCELMTKADYHPVPVGTEKKPVPADEQHGKDELINAQGSVSLARMVMVRGAARGSGTDDRIAFMVPCHELQVLVLPPRRLLVRRRCWGGERGDRVGRHNGSLAGAKACGDDPSACAQLLAVGSGTIECISVGGGQRGD